MVSISKIQQHIIFMLNSRLPASLTYHNVEHTLNVAKECNILAEEEGITDENTLQQLQIAALYHDTGFLYGRSKHEEKSCVLARKELPGFGVDEKSIDTVCEIILATRVPQLPKNILQQIICDADLAYLGNDDFFYISEQLHREFIAHDIVNSDQEWERSRILFMQSHSYFTTSAKKRHNPKKLFHLNLLINKANKKIKT